MPCDGPASSSRAPAFDIVERSLVVSSAGRSVPAALWLPARALGRPLVLVGHGGSGDKRSAFVTDVLPTLVGRCGFAVAAIDGPVHGERRRDAAAPLEVRDEFRRLWEQGGSVEPMVEDWLCTLETLRALPEVDADRVGYYGLSMGTAYGLPLLAACGGIRAAAIGMWGTSRVHGARLAADARQVRCPTLFSLQWDDEVFTREGQFELFDALACTDKHMLVYPGGHLNPAGRRLESIVQFLSSQLSA